MQMILHIKESIHIIINRQRLCNTHFTTSTAQTVSAPPNVLVSSQC